MTDSEYQVSDNLDKLVDMFYKDLNIKYKNDNIKRNEINKLYQMKENCKNLTMDSKGKIPTVKDITYFIYKLRWDEIIPI
jgi:hypothetical protein